jgi:hypothetical protein
MSSLLETIKNLSSKEIFIATATIIVVICLIVCACGARAENFVSGWYECDDYGCYGCDDYGCYECDDYGCYDCDEYGCQEYYGPGDWTGQENYGPGDWTGQENFFLPACTNCGIRSENFKFGLGCPTCK